MIKDVYQALTPKPVRNRLQVPFRRASRKLGYPPQHWRCPIARGMAQRLLSLKGTYRGRRCFVMGNGPSLNEMELSLLSDDFVWGSNRCYLLYDRINWRHQFFVSMDTRVLPDIADEVNELSDELPKTSFFFPYCFAQRTITPKPNVFFYNQVRAEANRPETMVSAKVERWVPEVSTVTIAAIHLATHLGFDPIYLIGCDTSYRVQSTVEIEDEHGNDFVSTADDDANHFDPRYFGKGRKWHDPHVDRMIAMYEVVKARSQASIVNATVGGNLEVFPRVEFKSLFPKVPPCK